MKGAEDNPYRTQTAILCRDESRLRRWARRRRRLAPADAGPVAGRSGVHPTTGQPAFDAAVILVL